MHYWPPPIRSWGGGHGPPAPPRGGPHAATVEPIENTPELMDSFLLEPINTSSCISTVQSIGGYSQEEAAANSKKKLISTTADVISSISIHTRQTLLAAKQLVSF